MTPSEHLILGSLTCQSREEFRDHLCDLLVLQSRKLGPGRWSEEVWIYNAHSHSFCGSLHESRILTGFAMKTGKGGGETYIFALLLLCFLVWFIKKKGKKLKFDQYNLGKQTIKKENSNIFIIEIRVIMCLFQ